MMVGSMRGRMKEINQPSAQPSGSKIKIINASSNNSKTVFLHYKRGQWLTYSLHLCYYNKIPQLDSFMKSRNLFLSVLDDMRFKIKVLAFGSR